MHTLVPELGLDVLQEVSIRVMKTINTTDDMTDEAEKEGDAPNEHALRADPLLAGMRKLYDDVASEPLPDHLLDLLDKLDKAERNR
ncbi:MAG: NepR family anti-sigma factor [Pseudomonadota bacterium]